MSINRFVLGGINDFVMKQLIVAILALLSCHSVFAQRIDTDETTRNRTRTIVTTEEEFYDDETVGMTFVISPKSDTICYINVTIEDWGKMEVGRSFFLKFKDGSIMELTNIKNEIAHPVAGHFGFLGPAMCLQPAYIVSLEQVKQICDNEVVKLRFEQGDDLLDRKIKRNRFSKIIKNCVALLNGNQVEKRDILKGF